MNKYIIRLDDACEKMDVVKWSKMEKLLDFYNIKPLVGVIPNCEDPMMEKYPVDNLFWEKVRTWKTKGWIIALHGYNHVYSTKCGGINPVNKRSEFAGESLIVQKEKIRNGLDIFRKHGIDTSVFFAPSHTFDENTLLALKEESKIRIINDTIAFDSYCCGDFGFIPQQSGKARKLPFKTITFCYHPNIMEENDYLKLEKFLKKNHHKFFSDFPSIKRRNKGFLDIVLEKIYFILHR